MAAKREKTAAQDLASLKEALFAEHPEVKAQSDQRQEARTFVASVRKEIADLRKRQDLKQSDMAERLGVSQPVISRIESDRNADLGLETLHRYAAACGLKPVVTFVPSAEAMLAQVMTRTAANGARPPVAPDADRMLLLAMQTFQEEMTASVAERVETTVKDAVRTVLDERPAAAAPAQPTKAV